MEDRKFQTISILGGTGNEGRGLAFRWAKAGYHLFIGSRSIEKAVAASEEVNRMLGGAGQITGMLNADAAMAGDIVVLTVPYAAHQPTLTEMKPYLGGKILVDVTVPLVPPKVSRVQMPAAGSAAVEAQLILGDTVAVVSAFQNISFENLFKEDTIECDILVCGDSPEAKLIVLELVEAMGLKGWDAGPLVNSMVSEGLTSILIGINKKHKVRSSGIVITGVN